MREVLHYAGMCVRPMYASFVADIVCAHSITLCKEDN